MAYNKSKGKQKHGDVIYEGDADTQIDFEQNEIKFRTGGDIRGSFTNSGLSITGSLTGMTTVSGSSTATFHSLDIGEGTLTVSKEGVVASSGSISGTVLSGSGFATLYGLNVGQGVMTVNAAGATATKNLTATGIISGSSTATLFALNVGQSTLTVSNQGLLSSSAIPTLKGVDIGQGALTVNSAGRLSSSAIPTLEGVDIGQGVFTVSNEGAVVGASLNNSSGGITNAGSIAGASTIDGSGDLTMGTITMSGFSVDADGDTNVKSLTSVGIVSGSTVTSNRLTVGEIGTDTDTVQIKLTNGHILIDGAVLTSSRNIDYASFGGALTSSQGKFHVDGNGSIYAVSGAFTVNSAGHMSASGNATFGGTITAANSTFTVDADGDTVVKTVSGSSVTTDTARFYQIGSDAIGQITLNAAGTTFTRGITGSTGGYSFDWPGSASFGQGMATVSSVGNFAAPIVSGSIVTANSAKLHTIGSDALTTNITLDVDGVKFVRGLSGSTHGYGLDWPGSSSFGQGMATISSVGALAAPSVASTTTVTAGTTVSGATAQANRLTVNEIGTDGDVSQITLTTAAIVISENITGSSAGSTFHWAGPASFDEGTVTITNDGVISGSKNIDILGTLKTAGERFSVDADGDTSVKSLTSEGVISGSSVTSDSGKFYQVGTVVDPDVMILKPAGANVAQFTTPVSSSGYISGTVGRFEDYVYATAASFNTLTLHGGSSLFSATTISGSSFSGSQALFNQIGAHPDPDMIVLNTAPATSIVTINCDISSSGELHVDDKIYAANSVFTVGSSGDVTTRDVSGSRDVYIGYSLTSSQGRFRVDDGGAILARSLEINGGGGAASGVISSSGQAEIAGRLYVSNRQLQVDSNGSLTSSGYGYFETYLQAGGGQFTVQNDGDVSGSGYAKFGGVLEAAGETFTCDSNGDLEARSLTLTHTLSSSGGGFHVDTDGDLAAKSLKSDNTISGAGNFYAGGGATIYGSLNLQGGHVLNASTMSASSNVNVGGTLFAANSGFTVDADGDTTVKSLTAAAGDVKGIVISGSSTATLYGLNVGQGVFTMDKEGIANQITATGKISGSAHAHFNTLSLGEDVGASTDAAALQLKALDDELVLMVRSLSNETILAATGSAGGQVAVGGGYLAGKFNVSGSDNDKLITAKSDTVNPAFYVSGSGDLYASGKIGIGTNDPLTKLDVNGTSIRIRTANTPASATALGAPGEIRWDANYIYICISTDTWRRISHASW